MIHGPHGPAWISISFDGFSWPPIMTPHHDKNLMVGTISGRGRNVYLTKRFSWGLSWRVSLSLIVPHGVFLLWGIVGYTIVLHDEKTPWYREKPMRPHEMLTQYSEYNVSVCCFFQVSPKNISRSNVELKVCWLKFVPAGLLFFAARKFFAAPWRGSLVAWLKFRLPRNISKLTRIVLTPWCTRIVCHTQDDSQIIVFWASDNPQGS